MTSRLNGSATRAERVSTKEAVARYLGRAQARGRGKPPESSLTASATRIKGGRISRSVAAPSSWQGDAWDMYDLVGEERFLASTIAGRLAQARLYVAMDGQSLADDAVVVEDDGRVYGHIAAWGTCHIGQIGKCVEPPTSPSNYAYFRTGALQTAEGTSVAVGHLTMGTGHAGPRDSANAAAEHYDNTGTVFADVAAGEDAYGIWVAGSLRPGITPEQVRVARSAPISGDWRTIRGALELVGALAVNVPGFPVPRPQGLLASGEVKSLQASGVVAHDDSAARAAHPSSRMRGDGLTLGDISYLRRLAESERRRDLQRATAADKMRARVERAGTLAKAAQMARRLGSI